MAVATCWEQCWQNRTLLDLLRGRRQLRSRFREMRSPVVRCTKNVSLMSAASMTFFVTSTLQKLCAATSRCGCAGVHVIVDLRTNGLRDVGACGHWVTLVQRMSPSASRGRVVENQPSVQRMGHGAT